MKLPKGMPVPEETITELEKLKTFRAVNPIDLINKFNEEINKLIENYNNSLAQQGGGGQQSDSENKTGGTSR